MNDSATLPKPTEKLEREAIVEALAHWHSLPVPLRKPRTLNQLAHQLGVHAGGRFYALARSPEVCYRMLMLGSGEGVRQMPDVLAALAEMAVRGNVAAAETYLTHIRLILTDERIIKALNPKPTNVHAHMQQVYDGAKKMIDLAESLGDDRDEAMRRWEEMKTNF